MSDIARRISGLSPEQRALLEKRLKSGGSSTVPREPIAIVGMGCRFPGGADGPEAFWRLLCEGRDAIREVPRERWDVDALYDPDPMAGGKMSSRWGGFLDEVDRFDAGFFGISPREAVRMDPQQRLLLEVAWNALENAGVGRESLAGSATGVFVGAHSHASDYLWLQYQSPETFDAFVGTGTAHNLLAGRLSYFLDLHGPAVVVDTACSSSLVAAHLAVQSLRLGESDVALAAGVNLILTPHFTIAASRMHMLAADGRCKAFDRRADGFVRGEGCGVVVLKRLSDALASGDPVVAVIRGSATNQDGHTNGITAPNGLSQQEVIRQALRNAGVAGARIGYVEAHGTGTALGDPIEVEALAATVGAEPRPDGSRCSVGSVKTNFGHLEGAAGIAGLIKAALVLEHATIPPNLHFTALNPHIVLGEAPLEFPTRSRPFDGEGSRFASVSSFGWSGTNAHVVLESAPDAESAAAPTQPGANVAAPGRRTPLLTLSAKSQDALRELTRRYAAFLGSAPADITLADICAMAAHRRSHHERRVALVAHSREEARSRLAAFVDGEAAPGVVEGTAPDSRSGLAMVFSGQGSQWFAMGRELIAEEPAFRRTLERCDELMREHASWSLLSELAADEASSRIYETEIAQPALFALQVGLVAVWRSWGIVPTSVVGHSVGEVAAAHVAGALSLEDAVRVIVQRGRIMQKAAGGGKMASVALGPEAARAELAPFGTRAAVAAINSPSSVVLSGEAAVIDEVVESLTRRGVFCRPLRVNCASHSPQMEPFRAELASALRGIRPRAAAVPMFSTVTGRRATGLDLEPAYWGSNLRDPVLFAAAVDAVSATGPHAWLEIGPHPVLAASVIDCLEAAGGHGRVLVSLRRGQEERSTLLEALAALYAEGFPVDWSGVLPAPRRSILLPSYPWQRQRYWLEQPTANRRAAATHPTRSGHPLLGGRVSTPSPTFETEVSLEALPLLDEHRLWDTAVVPLTAYLEMALAAAAEVQGPGLRAVEDVALARPLTVPEAGSRAVQIVLGSAGSFEIFGNRTADRSEVWTPLLSGRLAATATDARLELAQVRERCTQVRPGPEFYAELRGRGFRFGPMTEAIDTLWVGSGEALASLRLPSVGPTGAERYAVQPALLMNTFLVAWAASPAEPPAGQAYLPARLQAFRVLRASPARAFAHARLRSVEPDGLRMDLALCDEAGQLIAEAADVVFKLAGRETLREETASQDGWCYAVNWVAQPRGRGPERAAAADLPGPQAIAGSVAGTFERARRGGALERYARLLPELETLSALSAAEALRRLGVEFVPERAFTTDALAQQLRIVPAQLRLFARLLEMLEEEGVLERSLAGWRVLQPPAAIDVEHAWSALRAAHPEFDAEIGLVARCAPALADVLRGTSDPLDLLFPQGSFASTERLYQDSPVFSLYNVLAKEALAEAVRTLPADRRLRVLEIGAGTGGTTAHVLAALPAERTEYVFSDVSARFTSRAQEKFAGHPFVRYALLDIEQEAEAQGFASKTYDVVIAANVLHATRDLEETLARVRRLLAPGGLLLLFEVTAVHRWIDLSFGLTEGWWRFRDTKLRPSYPLLSRSRWLELLDRTGFTGATALPAAAADGVEARQSVFVAREPVTPQPQGRWLICADSVGVGRSLAAALRERGESCSLVRPSFATGRQDEMPLDPERREDAARLIRETAKPLRGVVHLWGLDATNPAPPSALLGEQRALCAGVVHLSQALSENAAPGARLFLVTRGAMPVGGSPVVPAQATLWGLARGIALEQPETWGAIIDLDPQGSADEAAAKLIEEILDPGADDQVALRRSDRLVPRLESAPVARLPTAPAWRPDRAYLVTGGLGGLGLKLARWLVDGGARHLALVGRTPLPPRADWASLAPGSEAARRVAAVQALEACGASVIAESVDIGDAAALGALLSRFGTREPALAGVFHAALDLAPCPLRELDQDRLAAMLHGKSSGAWLLHDLTRGMDLDCFVLFSSTTALWGATGYAHYAAANRFLDVLAHHRRALGLPALSVNWGTWEEMRGFSAAQRAEVEHYGLRGMASERALSHLADLLDADATQAVVAAVDWSSLKSAYEARRPQPFLERVGLVSPPSAPPDTPGPGLARRLQEAAPTERLELLERQVASEVARVLGLSARDEVDHKRGFFEMGMDSLTSAELRRRLEAGLGRSLPSTLAFNYPNVEALAHYLDDAVSGSGPVAQASIESRSRTPKDAAEIPSGAERLSEDELTERLSAKLRSLR
ncbi:MAG TPA: beta-ketoacyl synthase N-terminal-like domain-containing protein [Vicinamibacteria bacterium]|nr:beta-ketoacyl synthase N-terminal-like domain-containing protein [Vicinamibacteria bacterium]